MVFKDWPNIETDQGIKVRMGMGCGNHGVPPYLQSV